jgi:hypothetical protein
VPTRSCLLPLMFFLAYQDSGQRTPQPEQKPSEVALRDPFDLKLKLQDGSDYEEHFDRVPYIKDGTVYIFPGEKFGVRVSTTGEELSGLQYMKDSGKADLRLQLAEHKAGGKVTMMLVIESKLKQTLYMDALMHLPNRKGAYKTSILPVHGGKSGFESWPQPITALELKNLRFSASARPSELQP